jgi:hypothetical protein
MSKLCILTLGLWVLHLAPAPSAFAHEFRPVTLVIEEVSPGTYFLAWSQGEAREREAGPRLTPGLPAHCVAQALGDPSASRVRASCGTQGLSGQAISNLPVTEARQVVVQYRPKNGPEITQVIRSPQTVFHVPEARSVRASASSYFALGVEHILGGLDHLALVLGLAVLLGFTNRLFLAITAFTISHSLTLAVAALDLVRIAQPPIEAIIALSITFMAIEIGQRTQTQPTLNRTGGHGQARARREASADLPVPPAHKPRALFLRAPWTMAGVFGLIHGLGFAGALREIGLAPNALALSLVTFNAGVEVGQFMFLAALFALFIAGRSLWGGRAQPMRGWVLGFTSYAMGISGAFWCIERTIALV